MLWPMLWAPLRQPWPASGRGPRICLSTSLFCGRQERARVIAVKGPRQYRSRCIYKARVAPQGLVENSKKLKNVYRPCIFCNALTGGASHGSRGTILRSSPYACPSSTCFSVESRSMDFSTFFCATRSSYRLCRLSQNSAVVPNK
jgi:hypothetical protein